ATMVAFVECNRPVQLMRFDRALQPLDTPLPISPVSMLVSNPSVVWSGTRWLVTFEGPVHRNIRAVRVSSSMTPLDTEPILVAASDGRSPHTASSGNDDLIAWTRGGTEVFARRLLPNGTLGNEIRIADGVGTCAIWTGTEYAIGFTSSAG